MRFADIRYVITFLLFVLLQGMVFKNIVLFDYAFCFIYVYFLLSLPVDLRSIPAMLIGLAMGLSIDFFYDTGGIHAASSVLIMYLRGKWLNSITPQGGYDIGVAPTIHISGFPWYFGYALPVIFVHHLTLFFLEAYGFDHFWFTFYKALLSTLLTFVMCIVIQVLFVRRKYVQ